MFDSSSSDCPSSANVDGGFFFYVDAYHIPDVFNGGKVWAHCWPWHLTDVVLLEVSNDDSCTLSTGIVVMKNKMSTHTPTKRDDKQYQYIVPIVLSRVPFLHNMEVGWEFCQSR